MACAGWLLVVLASVALHMPDAARENAAQPTFSPPRIAIQKPINLSLPARIHNPAMAMSGSDFSSPQFDAAQVASSHVSINLGPLHTEFGGTTGRHMHLATVKLEGVSVFGGSIGGSIDSRSARIILSWHTGN